MIENWIEHELRNWARWCNSGPFPHPMLPDHCASLEGGYLAPAVTGDDDVDPNKPPPIHIESAQRVQRVYDVAFQIERKVLQAEYLSPWQYARYSGGIGAAVRRLNAVEPSIKLSVTSYETILISLKQRVEKAFR